MTVKGGTTPACAACKYQRRKCSPNCPLAPYFPANQLKTFQNVHRLFGVSNVTKTLERLNTKDEKEDAMKSIIFEAEMRERFPVHGCCAIIAQLRLQLHFAIDELRHMHVQLEACRDQQIGDSPPVFQNKQPFGMNNNYDYDNDSGNLLLLDEEVRPLLSLEGLKSLNSENNLLAIQAQMDALQCQDLEGNCEIMDALQCQDLEGNCKISSCDYSDQILPEKKDCRTELKTAAAGFRLTTVK